MKELRADALKARRIWVVWVAEPKQQSEPFWLSEKRRTIIEDLKPGRSINSELFAAAIADGFATRLSPLGDADATTAKDVKAAAENLRNRWAPIDVVTVRSGLKTEPRRGPIGGFDPPPLQEGPEAIKAVKFEVVPPKSGAKRPADDEVGVRFIVPAGKGRFSMVTFQLFEKNADGTRGPRVGGERDLIAWGYANRPALCQVPVTAASANGYDVEIIAAKYR